MSSEISALLPLLAAMQYGDSAYPAGGFAQSWGLETAVAEGSITAADELEQICRTLLRVQAAPVDGVAASACAALAAGDFARFAAIDRQVSACRAARETRQASERMGRRLLDTAQLAEDDRMLDELSANVRAGETPGNVACVLGLLAGRLGLSAEAAAGLTLWAGLNGMLAAALRLLPITHDDVQRTLTRLRPLVADLACHAAVSDADALGGTVPLQEIWSMRHETGLTRLFAS